MNNTGSRSYLQARFETAWFVSTSGFPPTADTIDSILKLLDDDNHWQQLSARCHCALRHIAHVIVRRVEKNDGWEEIVLASMKPRAASVIAGPHGLVAFNEATLPEIEYLTFIIIIAIAFSSMSNCNSNRSVFRRTAALWWICRCWRSKAGHKVIIVSCSRMANKQKFDYASIVISSSGCHLTVMCL